MLFDGLSEIEENDGKWWFQSQKINSQNLLKAIEACENLQVQRRLTDNARADDESYTKSSTTLVIQRYCGQRGRNDLGHCCR